MTVHGEPPATAAPGEPAGAPLQWNGGKLLLVLGIVSAVLVCCCIGGVVSGLTWGRALYHDWRERTQPSVGQSQPVESEGVKVTVDR